MEYFYRVRTFLLLGVLRSGTTVSIFLIRGDREDSFCIIFYFGFIASFVAGFLAIIGGNISLTLTNGFLASFSSAVVGYAIIELL